MCTKLSKQNQMVLPGAHEVPHLGLRTLGRPETHSQWDVKKGKHPCLRGFMRWGSVGGSSPSRCCEWRLRWAREFQLCGACVDRDRPIFTDPYSSELLEIPTNVNVWAGPGTRPDMYKKVWCYWGQGHLVSTLLFRWIYTYLSIIEIEFLYLITCPKEKPYLLCRPSEYYM